MEEGGSHQNIDKPHLEFEEGRHSILSIFQNYPLPVVLQCDKIKHSVPVDKSNMNFDLTQPLLIYRKRRIQKIPASNLYIDEKSRSFKEIGDPLLIPEDYKGYFAVIRKRNTSGPADDYVPHFTHIEELAGSETEYFLIGGQISVKGINYGNHCGSSGHQPRTLFPGEVLKKTRIFLVETKKKTGIFGRRGSVVSEKYLCCLDEAEKEVLINFTEVGLFYALSNQSKKATCPVMQMESIVAQKLLPCVVKLVYGLVPNTNCSFSGLLRLEKSQFEQSVIASTIMNDKNILIEIPVTCELDFQIAVNNKDLLQHEGYTKALALCREKAQRYMTNIKVCLHPQQDTRTESTSSIVSDETRTKEIEHLPAPCTKNVQRDSGYIPMVGSSKPKHEDTSPVFDEPDEIYIPMGSLSPDPGPYMLNVFLNDQDSGMPTQESKNSGNKDNIDIYLYDQKSSHVQTGPPRSPPPPRPCIPKLPTPCNGSPTQDSGISDDSSSDNRRPSTFLFSEIDDTTYDIPKIPVRREGTSAEYTNFPHVHSKSFPTMHSFHDNRHPRPHTLLPPSTLPLRHVNSTGCYPIYVNEEGLKQITAKLQQIAEARNICEESEGGLTCFSDSEQRSCSVIPPTGSPLYHSERYDDDESHTHKLNINENERSPNQSRSDVQTENINDCTFSIDDPSSDYAEIQDVQTISNNNSGNQQMLLMKQLPSEILESSNITQQDQVVSDLPPEILESPFEAKQSPYIQDLPAEILGLPGEIKLTPSLQDLPAEILGLPGEIKLTPSLQDLPSEILELPSETQRSKLTSELPFEILDLPGEKPRPSMQCDPSSETEKNWTDVKDDVKIENVDSSVRLKTVKKETQSVSVEDKIQMEEGNIIDNNSKECMPITNDKTNTTTVLESKKLSVKDNIILTDSSVCLQKDFKTPTETTIPYQEGNSNVSFDTNPNTNVNDIKNKPDIFSAENKLLNNATSDTRKHHHELHWRSKSLDDGVPSDNKSQLSSDLSISDNRMQITRRAQRNEIKKYREKSKTLWSVLRAMQQEEMDSASLLPNLNVKTTEAPVRREYPVIAPKPKSHKSSVLPRPRRKTTECTITVQKKDTVTCSPAEHHGHDDSQISVPALMTEDQLDMALMEVGVKLETRDLIKSRGIDKQALISMDPDNLREELPGISKIELTKISMYIRGMSQ